MLFKDLNKLREYCDMANGAAFKRLEPIMKAVEENQISSIIGKPLYVKLRDAYKAASNEDLLSEREKSLLHEVRKVLAPLLMYHYAPIAELNMNDAGLQRMETANNKTAFAYQIANYRKAQLLLADQATEQLYAFLEDNKTVLPEWEEARKKYAALFIKTGSEFGELFTSHSPYRNYYAMRSKMADVELLYLKPAIGADIFEHFKTKDTAGTEFSETEKNILVMVKKAIAYYTIAFAVPFLNVRIDEEGITVVSDAGNANVSDKRKNADADAINHLLRNATATAQEWLSVIKKTIAKATINSEGFLVIADADSSNSSTNDPNALQDINLSMNQGNPYPAEQYNPRSPWDGEEKKGSFSL